jgi:hypothetical protein
MANFDVARAIFTQVDTNKDGRYEIIIFKKFKEIYSYF